jgi:hypothetical protein
MRITPYLPPTVAPATPADLTDINAKIAALEAGEADDATIAALEAVRDAIPNISPLLDKLATPRDWVPGEDVKAGYQRYHYIHDTGLMVAPYTNFTRVQVLVESISDRKTSTTFDGPEAAQWKYLSQNRVGAYLGGEVVVKSYRHRAPDGKIYEAVDNGGIRSTFLASEWKEVSAQPETTPWALSADIPSVNLADWTNTGRNTVLNILVPNRACAKLDTLSFRLFDRRGGNLATRTKNITVVATDFSYTPSNGWAAWVDNSFPAAIWKDFTMSDGSVYRIHLHFMAVPNGLAISFRDSHGGQENTYGAVDTIKATFVKA